MKGKRKIVSGDYGDEKFVNYYLQPFVGSREVGQNRNHLFEG